MARTVRNLDDASQSIAFRAIAAGVIVPLTGMHLTTVSCETALSAGNSSLALFRKPLLTN